MSRSCPPTPPSKRKLITSPPGVLGAAIADSAAPSHPFCGYQFVGACRRSSPVTAWKILSVSPMLDSCRDRGRRGGGEGTRRSDCLGAASERWIRRDHVPGRDGMHEGASRAPRLSKGKVWGGVESRGAGKRERGGRAGGTGVTPPPIFNGPTRWRRLRPGTCKRARGGGGAGGRPVHLPCLASSPFDAYLGLTPSS